MFGLLHLEYYYGQVRSEVSWSYDKEEELLVYY